MSGLVLLLVLGSVYRLTLLVTDDEITAPARDAALRWLQQPLHRPVDEIKTVDGMWLSLRCRCGHRVWRADNGRVMVRERHGGTGTVVAVNNEPMAVLSYFNSHRNAHHEHRFTALPVLITCPWCASMYLAPVVVASAISWGGYGWWQLIAGTLTASAVTGIVATFAKP